MVFENGVKNIQAAAYIGTRMVHTTRKGKTKKQAFVAACSSASCLKKYFIENTYCKHFSQNIVEMLRHTKSYIASLARFSLQSQFVCQASTT